VSEDHFPKKHFPLTIVRNAPRDALRIMNNIDLEALHKLHLATKSTLEALERNSLLGGINKGNRALMQSLFKQGSASRGIKEFGHQLQLSFEYEELMNLTFLEFLLGVINSGVR
jgi:hypothetical protein